MGCFSAFFARFVGVASPLSPLTLRRRLLKKLASRSSQTGDCGQSRPSVASLDELSVEFSKMEKPSTKGPSSSSLSRMVSGDELDGRASGGRCMLRTPAGRAGTRGPGFSLGSLELGGRSVRVEPDSGSAARCSGRGVGAMSPSKKVQRLELITTRCGLAFLQV